MRVAIQTRDLDHARIDGTRVYLNQLLRRFGTLRPDIKFFLYHRDTYNPLLVPPTFVNYHLKKLPGKFAWMQTAFAQAMFQERPEKVFLPLQAAPLFFPRSVELTATVHDLAFRFYPQTFPFWTRHKLRFFARLLLWRATKIIAVSHATKRDLIHFFPETRHKPIQVIHHGFDADFFQVRLSEKVLSQILEQYNITQNKYLLYVGALQPRKNIARIITAFEQLKGIYPEAKLVLAGEAAWLSEDILKQADTSLYAKDIIRTGGVDFETLRALYQGARVFVFPSLYEGFGLPILEAFASRTAVLISENSSLREVAGEGAWYCDAFSVEDMASQMQCLWRNNILRDKLIVRGLTQLEKFSWDRAARETLDFILSETVSREESQRV
jgi:glycosyltransferase involved in cell wall biosynthesis